MFDKCYQVNSMNQMTSREIWPGSADPGSPFLLFERWYTEHLVHGYAIPDNMFLATSSMDGRVSLRTVLLKDYSDEGFTFFTNYNSLKARQLDSNGNAAILFYWSESGRQVRIEGKTRKSSSQASDEYFKTRPRESQLSAWASNQSSEIPGRDFLEERMNEFREKFSGSPVPRPDHWGGYIIIPGRFEFWEDRPDRLHDRIVYEREGDGWKIKILSP